MKTLVKLLGLCTFAYLLLFRGSSPTPLTAPGYGKRRQTQWMKDWRNARTAEPIASVSKETP